MLVFAPKDTLRDRCGITALGAQPKEPQGSAGFRRGCARQGLPPMGRLALLNEDSVELSGEHQMEYFNMQPIFCGELGN